MKSLAVVLALLAATVAFVAYSASAASTGKAPTVTQTMVIVGHALGQKGSDGLRHDTTLGANFSVPRGARVVVTVYNYDEGPHTITSPKLGLNFRVPGAKDEEAGIPSKRTFSFVATKTGRFIWFCALPCDAGQKYWDMQNPTKKIGFMAGYITVSA